MANQIRLKRASGSDPSASDLVLGEPAVRTDTGEIFLKKDDGSIAKVAGGIEDGDKGDITVSNDGATFTIDNDAVTYAKIQNVSATNRILGRDSSGAGVIEEITPANLRTMINVEDGATADQSASEIVALIADQTIAPSTIDMEDNESILLGTGDDLLIKHNGTNAIFQNTSGDVKFFTTGTLRLRGDDIILSDKDQVESYIVCTKNSDVELYFNNSKKLNTSNTGIDVIGNIVVSGTVDGRDIATDGSKLDGIASGATNVTNTNQLTNGAGFITATLTNEQVQDIVGGMVSGNTESGITVTYQDSDGTLDFSVASQTDNNFTNADHSKLDGIEAGATADQSASEILTLLKTVDGDGSGLDADTLDGISSGSFLRSDAADSSSEDITINGLKVGEWSAASSYKGIFHSSQTGSEYMMISQDDHTFISASTGGSVYVRTGNNDSTNQLIVSNGSNGLTWRGNKVFHAGNDGAGSGLDADSVDGIAGSSLLRSDAADTASGDITFAGGAGAITVQANSDIRFANGTWSGNTTTPKIQAHNSALYIVGGASGIFFRENSTNRWHIDGDGHFDPATDSTFDIGQSDRRVRKGYFDEVDSSQVLVNNGILETKAAIATSHTLATGFNAMAVSPTINSGVTITVPSGAVWAIV